MKAPILCPCCRLATLNGAPRTLLFPELLLLCLFSLLLFIIIILFIIIGSRSSSSHSYNVSNVSSGSGVSLIHHDYCVKILYCKYLHVTC